MKGDTILNQSYFVEFLEVEMRDVYCSFYTHFKRHYLQIIVYMQTIILIDIIPNFSLQ
jgi:hypothetical protein